MNRREIQMDPEQLRAGFRLIAMVCVSGIGLACLCVVVYIASYERKTNKENLSRINTRNSSET